MTGTHCPHGYSAKQIESDMCTRCLRAALEDARRERDEARAALRAIPSPQRIAEAVRDAAAERCGEAARLSREFHRHDEANEAAYLAGEIRAMDLAAIIAAVKP